MDAERVLHAAAEMVWVPPESEHVLGNGFEMVRYGNGFPHDTGVFNVASDADPADLIRVAEAQAGAWSRHNSEELTLRLPVGAR